MALTKKQKLFCDDYIITLNGTESYKKFYKNVKSDQSAAVCASRILNSPDGKAYIDERMKALDEQMIADQREVLRGLTKQFRREEYDYEVVLVKKPIFDDQGKYVGLGETAELIKVPTQNRDAIRAGELLGKRYGLFTDKLDMSSDLTLIFEDDYGDDDDDD